jgi:hypothetical protein
LFAATLFVSASLLFMVQPMVGKMVLPLLGGSPAVWNACMVFFQALLLLGYLYAHHISGRYLPRKQWYIHLLVLGLPLAAFVLAVLFGQRHSPIAIAESLAPGGESSPILSVLLLLTVAIGVPFFVVSTSAPLLQKWFTCTGHPSARDPYFLYSASNFGSMISLLGYPLFIEPYLTIIEQAWVFAAGFAILAVLITLCGQAAANPIGVPPTSVPMPTSKLLQKSSVKNGQQLPSPRSEGASETEVRPTLVRKLKWITLAFIPSSLMLGVTFYMTTDIASIPLLWVAPLALYLITFIIAFGRVPDWFRLVIGNLAPVMILLLVFVMLSGVSTGIGVTLILHLLTFFATALMCHYELARDRPSAKYLTEFFLLMSVGGVLGGIFNSLLAPLIFPHAYEYRLVLVLACLMVPRLTDLSESATEKQQEKLKKEGEINRGNSLVYGGSQPTNESGGRVSLALDIVIPVLLGVGFYFFQQLPGVERYAKMVKSIADTIDISVQTISTIFIYAIPVMVCFFFVDRPLRFALSVAAILGYTTYREEASEEIYSERSFFGILKVKNIEYKQDPSHRLAFNLTDQALAAMQNDGIPVTVLTKLLPIKDTKYSNDALRVAIAKLLTEEELKDWVDAILIHSRVEHPENVYSGEIIYHQLVHGTTLHGTQIYSMQNNVFDLFQLFTAVNPWDNVVVAGANTLFDPRQEPLTYYHRSGPVGMMVHELRTRKGGADAKLPFAMVGLGTGSASCYALPGQKLTFYEIDPAVKHLTYDMDKYFTYVTDAKKRGGELDIHMGDARLKLKEDTDRKYALLLVDAFSSDSIPVHLLTQEAVQLYFDRLTDDGLLALHISNKYVRLEPVVSAIARELNLTARVWNDDSEIWNDDSEKRPGKTASKKMPGKTASSWVVLARSPAQLGKLYTPIGDLPFALEPDKKGDERQQHIAVLTSRGDWVAQSYMESSITSCLTNDYSKDLETKTNGKDKATELNEADSPREAWLAWIKEKLSRVTDPAERSRLEEYEKLIDQLTVYRITNEVLISLKMKNVPESVLVRLNLLTDQKFKRENFITELNKFLSPDEMNKYQILIMNRAEQSGGARTLQEAMLTLYGHAFRKLEYFKQVHAWTDDYSDVMRVMMIPELQAVRKFFGLPTPIER